MNPDQVERVAVLGGGVMGHGIAQVAAAAGFQVTVRDVAQEFLDGAQQGIERSLRRAVDRGRMTEEAARAILERISLTLDLHEAVGEAELVIEAVPEDLALKHRVWREVSEKARRDALLATNTSSLSITSIAEAVSRPERFVGIHFFNPPVLMKLVEVIPGARTSTEAVELAEALAERMGKKPVAVKRDTPGFIVNRVLVTYLNEAAKLLDAGYTKEQIDSAMQHREGMPLGPFMLADLIGLDIVHSILKVFQENLGPEYGPAKSIEELFTAGKLGRKTGEGFYSYEERPSIPKEAGEGFDVNLLLDSMIEEAEKIVREGIADEEAVDAALKLGANLPLGPFEMKGRRRG